MIRKNVWLTVLVMSLLAAMAGACAPLSPAPSGAISSLPPVASLPATISPATSTAVPATVSATATMAATSQATMNPGIGSRAVENLAGQRVDVMGVWSGVEFDDFQLVVAAWQEQTGGVVDWEGARDISTMLPRRIQESNRPDIAIVPNPGLMHALAREGALLPLDSVLDMEQVRRDYAPTWIDLGSYNSKLYAILYRAHNRETVWYNPKAFADGGYTTPRTWDEWMALASKMVADGRTPFSIATESGPGTGWSLTDWISEIVMNNCGPDTYDAWIAHEIPWTDPCIKQSFELFGTIVGTEGYVLGGVDGIIRTNVDAGGYAMYTDPAQAYMDYLSSFEQRIISTEYPELEPVSEYNFFPFPTIKPEHDGAVSIGADAVVMLNDTPAARSFLTFMAGAEAQSIWVKQGGFLSLNSSVPAEDYPDALARAAAENLTNAKVSRFGAGDNMPAAMQQVWWKQMLAFVRNPDDVDSILNALEATAKSVYE